MIAAMAVAPSDALLDALRRDFGHQDFRPGQQEVVDAVLGGRDTVVVMPTGGGKSLTYQLPALVGGGLTVVVSPLIALMDDQVEALRRRRIAAAALHSNLDGAAQRQALAAAEAGALRLLYVAPERLVRSDVRRLVEEHHPRRVVVDEAHCISEWGHDFRRDYLRIAEVVDAAGRPQVVACTATATPEVRDDIAARLHLRSPAVFVHGFARPNLFLAAERVRGEQEKLARLDAVLDPGDGHAIVYAGTRARAADLATRIGRRLPTMLYHADLPAEARAGAQQRFRDGDVRVAVTTSAFGMGIDVPTVRQVIHVALPSSLEEYYQQAGRAGRDGLPATCTVIHTAADRRLPQFFIDAAHPDAATLAAVHRSVHEYGRDPGSWRALCLEVRAPRLSDAAGAAALEILRDAGVIRGDGSVVAPGGRDVAVDHGRIAMHRRLAQRRLSRLLDYLGATRCRHRTILEHFGEAAEEEGCDVGCDVCRGGAETVETPLDADTVRKALSAVARLNGRFGVSRVAALLVGSRSRQMEAMPELTSLPTYGALAGWREQDAAEVLRRLVDSGALRQGPEPYPTLSLTASGVGAMRGEATLSIGDPRRVAARRGGGEAPQLDAAAAALFERLRSWRARRARERDVPAYVVFPDRTLVAIAASRPGTEAELLAVPGVGPAKLALHGSEVLAVVAEAQTAA